MTNNTDPVRALIEKWRSESTSDDQSSDYECGEHSARSECANELESALSQQPAENPPSPDVAEPAEAAISVIYTDGNGASRRSPADCRYGVMYVTVGDTVYWPLSADDAQRLHSAECGNGDFTGPAEQQPVAAGEEIMVNAAHDVYTLPLQPSGLLSGPRFVVHVPAPEQPPAAPSGEAVAPAEGIIERLEAERDRCDNLAASTGNSLTRQREARLANYFDWAVREIRRLAALAAQQQGGA